jgi:antitoxin HigA-1
MTRLPKNRPPTHPGEILIEEFIHEHGLSQSEVARRLDVSFPRLNEIVKGKRGVTTDTALRLERLFGVDAEMWLNLQRDWDLWQARRSPVIREIERIEPLAAA